MSNNTPEIRFKGFTHAWEQRKLKDVATYSNGGSFENDVQEKGRYELITLKSVDMDGNLINSGRYVDIEVPTLIRGTLVMILSEQSPGLLGMTAQIPVDNKYILNQRVAEIRPNKSVEGYFLSMVINKNQQYFSRCGAGTKVQNISKPNVENYEFLCPILQEQQKIGQFLSILGETITLHKRKLDGLKELKRGYLQQMFPQAGESVPLVRFAGFTKPWQKRTLGDVVERVTRKNKGLKSTLALTISAQHGLIAQKDFFDKEVASKDVSNYYLVRNGEFAYNKSYSNGYPWGAVKRLDNYEIGVLSTLYIVFKPTTIDSEFLAQYYETTHWHNEVAQYAAEGARNHGLLNIATSDFFETVLAIPTDSNEQTAIGNFFRTLDGQIIAQEQKLSRLKQLKSAYLQKMLI